MNENMENLENSSEPKARFNSETIRGIVVLFYKNLLSPSSRQYTIAYSLCKVLAKRFDDVDHVTELEKIYAKTTIGYPLGILQTIVYRDIMLGFSTNKSYNYGYQTKSVRLGDMILALDVAMDRIFDIFTEICVDNELDTTSLFPVLDGMLTDRSGM